MTRVLVIEDEAELLQNVEEILELSNYEVITADNGLTGLELAQTISPDIIICDIMMPALDGYSVLKSLRENQVTQFIPVILVTAKAERSNQRLGMDLGADDYITKPFTTEELLKAIAARLKRQSLISEKLQQESEKLKQAKREALLAEQESLKNEQKANLKSHLLNKLVADLADPTSNINMAILMLKEATSEEKVQRYLEILQKESEREIKLLNEIVELQDLLTPENTEILRRYNILNFKEQESYGNYHHLDPRKNTELEQI